MHANDILYRIESLRFKTVRYTTGYYSINQSIQTCKNAEGGGGDFSSKQNTASVKETTEENSILILILFNLNQGMQYNWKEEEF